MNIAEAMEAVSHEYDRECVYTRGHAEYDAMMQHAIHEDYEQLDLRLPSYVSQIAGGMGVPHGTVLPEYVYIMARMCFRFGMRTQRKLDHPERETTTFWQSGVPQ